jgi:hypothetical protein
LSKLDKSLLKVVFAEVIKGFSFAKIPDVGEVKINHLTNLDSAGIDLIRQKYFLKASEKGLPTEKERLAELNQQGSWTDLDERKLKEQKDFLDNLYQTRSQLFLERDKKDVNKKINQTQELIYNSEIKKIDLLGLTCELYSNKRVSEYYIAFSIRDKNNDFIYKNSSGDVDLGDLETHEFQTLKDIYTKKMSQFDSVNLKRVSVSPFFLNFYSLCDKNPQVFYGKPIVELTFHQAELATYARTFMALVENAKTPAPNYLFDDPDALIAYYEGQSKGEDLIEKGENSDGSTIVGASKEELSKLGVKKEKGKDLAQEAASKGGSLSMQDLMKLHGIK